MWHPFLLPRTFPPCSCSIEPPSPSLSRPFPFSHLTLWQSPVPLSPFPSSFSPFIPLFLGTCTHSFRVANLFLLVFVFPTTNSRGFLVALVHDFIPTGPLVGVVALYAVLPPVSSSSPLSHSNRFCFSRLFILSRRCCVFSMSVRVCVRVCECVCECVCSVLAGPGLDRSPSTPE